MNDQAGKDCISYFSIIHLSSKVPENYNQATTLDRANKVWKNLPD